MRSQHFGIEIEMTGITRATAAQVCAGYFDTSASHVGGGYDTYTVRDGEGRQWKFMSDASIHAETRRGRTSNTDYRVEMVSPICRYDDIATIQEIVRKLRGAGAKVNDSCGIHVHVDASAHNEKTLRNIVNIMAAKEDWADLINCIGRMCRIGQNLCISIFMTEWIRRGKPGRASKP